MSIGLLKSLENLSRLSEALHEDKVTHIIEVTQEKRYW